MYGWIPGYCKVCCQIASSNLADWLSYELYAATVLSDSFICAVCVCGRDTNINNATFTFFFVSCVWFTAKGAESKALLCNFTRPKSDCVLTVYQIPNPTMWLLIAPHEQRGEGPL